jgi:uncharacterized small protein (DUF1192 family)
MSEPKKLTPEEFAIVKKCPIGHVPELLDHIAALEAEITRLQNWIDHVKKAVNYPLNPEETNAD